MDALGILSIVFSGTVVLFLVAEKLIKAGKRDQSVSSDIEKICSEIVVVREEQKHSADAIAALTSDMILTKDKVNLLWKTCVESALTASWNSPYAKEGNSLTSAGLDLIREVSSDIISTLQYTSILTKEDEASILVARHYREIQKLASKHSTSFYTILGLLIGEADSIVKMKGA